MIEVERKYRITDKQEIISKLNKLGYIKLKTVHQKDNIYLKNSKSFTDGFKKDDPIMRIRTIGKTHILTYKRSINDDGDSIEHEMEVNPVNAAIDLLDELGYKIVTNVDKIRTEFKLGNITVAVDEVAKLGSFIEVEILCNKGTEDITIKRVVEAASNLGLTDQNIEHKKYDRLMSEL
jgi:adenylate cyclase class 2